MAKEKTAVIAFRVPESVKERLETIARFQGVTVSSLVSKVVLKRTWEVEGMCPHEFVSAEGVCGRCGAGEVR